ncbi:ubiquitin carboxyl-terminal hydrolase 36 isoform X2 [Sitophilus oryzae]|uniref:Ubiquitin carboxyl-terminal hydrolase n=1 Tax=Sitophilus oryzae TaxID=7048 RepID=A0A6J2YC54_SITOR|nr:ubiquitin carboxyl-terminal hydrolase 36 isoform X2 [Sitophilus oryzae]
MNMQRKFFILIYDNSQSTKQEQDNHGDDTLKLAKHELFPMEKVQLGWSTSGDWSVGAGMVNMGNTCYLNSTLQALFHVPSLVNWLMSDKEHIQECHDTGVCIICAMRKTLQESQQRNVNSIRPVLIYNKLRFVCRNLIPGRQEDAHEFLRYLIEAMEKSYLQRFKDHNKFDSKIKETTPLNQILGGYLRSAVRCLRCGHVSTTFQHFQDLLLDIRKAQTVGEALELYFSREKLDDDSYHCEACQKKVPANKQFSIERAPKVLCIQLKRFSVSNNKITKHVAFKHRLNLTHYVRPRPNTPLIYRLVALVTHMGPTVSCGHYTAVAQAPSGNFYQFDDSMVRSISHQTVFNTNAYIMLYELESQPQAQKSVPVAPKTKVSSTITEAGSTSSANSSAASSASAKSPSPIPLGYTNGKAKVQSPNPKSFGFTSDKMYGPELPPERTIGSTVTNGKQKAVSSSRSTDESSSESSEEEDTSKRAPAPPSHSFSLKEADSSTLNEEPLDRVASPRVSPSSSNLSTSVSSLSSPEVASAAPSPKKTTVTSPSKSLVPYETGDTSGSEDSNHSESNKVTTKTTAGEWQVTSSTDVTSQREKEWCEQKNNKNMEISNGSVVSELFKMSTGGYSVPITTWEGTRSQLDKEVNQEKREERKRSYVDSTDQGRVKHQKVSSSYSNGKSNPGYNPVQEYHNMKNWSNGNGLSSGMNFHHKPFYNGARHKKNFHHKNSFHKNNYRFR